MQFSNILLPLYLLATTAKSAPRPYLKVPQKTHSTIDTRDACITSHGEDGSCRVASAQRFTNEKRDILPLPFLAPLEIAETAESLAHTIVGSKQQKEEDLKKGIYDRNGNIKLTFNKESTTIGNIELDDIFKNLREACHSQGVCETNRIVLKGQLIGEGTTSSVHNIELTLSPNGAYGTPHYENLLKVLETAVREMAQCQDYTHKTPCSNPMAYCPSVSKTYTRCAVPSFWSVNIQNIEDRDTTNAPSFMSTDLEMEIVGNSVCQDTFATLSEFGGLLSGRLGDGLNLWQLACV